MEAIEIVYNEKQMKEISSLYQKSADDLARACSLLVKAANSIQTNYSGEGDYLFFETAHALKGHLHLLESSSKALGQYVSTAFELMRWADQGASGND